MSRLAATAASVLAVCLLAGCDHIEPPAAAAPAPLPPAVVIPPAGAYSAVPAAPPARHYRYRRHHHHPVRHPYVPSDRLRRHWHRQHAEAQ